MSERPKSPRASIDIVIYITNFLVRFKIVPEFRDRAETYPRRGVQTRAFVRLRRTKTNVCTRSRRGHLLTLCAADTTLLYGQRLHEPRNVYSEHAPSISFSNDPKQLFNFCFNWPGPRKRNSNNNNNITCARVRTSKGYNRVAGVSGWQRAWSMTITTHETI